MKKISLKVLTLVAVLATGLVTAQTSDNQTTLNQIAAYRNWTRVNREPVQVKAAVQVVTPATVDLSAVTAV